jgi:hypothetical protein
MPRNMNTELATVIVAGVPLLTALHEHEPVVLMRNMSETLGLPWHAQRERIHDTPGIGNFARIIRVPSLSGGSQEALCLPVKRAFAWLMTVPVKRIRDPDVRARIDDIQRESLDAIWDYWTRGSAHNPRLVHLARTEQNRQALARKHLPATLARLERANHPTTHRIDLALARADCDVLGIEPPTAADYPLAQPDLFDRQAA